MILLFRLYLKWVSLLDMELPFGVQSLSDGRLIADISRYYRGRGCRRGSLRCWIPMIRAGKGGNIPQGPFETVMFGAFATEDHHRRGGSCKGTGVAYPLNTSVGPEEIFIPSAEAQLIEAGRCGRVPRLGR